MKEKVYWESKPSKKLIFVYLFYDLLFIFLGSIIISLLRIIYTFNNSNNLQFVIILSFFIFIGGILLFIIYAVVNTSYRYKITNKGIYYHAQVYGASAFVDKEELEYFSPFDEIININIKQNFVERIFKLYTIQVKCEVNALKDFTKGFRFEGLSDVDKPMKTINKFYKKSKKQL